MNELARLLEPWKTLYADSTTISTAVTTLHLFALMVGGGLAIAADRSTLRTLQMGRAASEREYQLRELGAVHRPVLIGLFVLVVTGLLLAAADVETFAVSAVFWVKMGLIGTLFVNGLVLYRTERKLAAAIGAGASPPEALWGRLKVVTWTSLTLWLLTAAAGALLTAAA